MNDATWMALLATVGTWLITALGAATVFFFRKTNLTLMNAMLGFAAGVMIAASFWSLLQPAIAQAETHLSTPSWLVATVGFALGALFIWGSDRLVTHIQKNSASAPPTTDQARLKRIYMLILSITLHNIPEGLAVGVAFGALHELQYNSEALLAAMAVAVGIALQNFPEGAAVSIPLRREGYSRSRAFFLGQSSALVEPIAGVVGALLVITVQALLPYALAFAAGAMILVSVHELVPECQSNRESHPYISSMGIIAGFCCMMLLDVMVT